MEDIFHSTRYARDRGTLVVIKEQSVNDWRNFKTLFWKNWCVSSSVLWVNVLSLLSPLFFSLILVMLRFETHVEFRPATQFSAVDLHQKWEDLIKELTRRYDKLKNMESFEYSVYVPRLVVAYSPHNIESYASIMRMAAEKLNNIELIEYPNCKVLRDSMIAKHYLAGVCFNESIPYMNTMTIRPVGIYHNWLKFTLVFPSELRLYNNTYISSHWSTNTLYRSFDQNNRLDKANDGGFPGYVREGFIPLQNAITASYLHLIPKSTPDVQIENVTLRRFPNLRHTADELSFKLEYCLGSIILAGYIFPMLQLIKYIVTEREDNVYNALTNIGVRKFLHYIAWFVYGVLTLTFSISLVLFVLTLRIDKGFAVLTKSSFSALLFYFVFFNMATMSFCLMISAFFTSVTSAVLASGLLWFITYIPFLSFLYDEKTHLPSFVQYTCSNTVLSISLSLILDFENSSDGFHWHDIVRPRTVDSSSKVSNYILLWIVQTLVYSVIGLLGDQLRISVVESYRTLLPERSVTRAKSISASTPTVLRSQRSEIIEVDSAERVCTVTVKNVSKEYNGVRVVNDVSMKLYENTITVLMGHNSSGKSSLLSMIADVEKPTEGSITLDRSVADGRKGVTYGTYIKEGMLFRQLSLAKQLIFFSCIKGSEGSKVDMEVAKYMHAMNLVDKKHVRTEHLTLGFKQGLAVCCALVGNSRIVVLDEPTTYMDDEGRKCFWKMITEEKRNRTIIISSHIQEEAKMIADRLAILNEGVLKYIGSTLLLKHLYGQNYRVVCTKSHDCKVEDVTKLLQKYVPDIRPMSNVGNELSYTIPKSFLPVMTELIDELEEHSAELDIRGFELSENSLNDIFFMLGAQDASEGNTERLQEIMSGKTIYFREYENPCFLAKAENVTGCQLWLNQVYAMLLKRLYHARHYKTMHILQLFVPVAVAMVAVVLIQQRLHYSKLRPLEFTYDHYKSSMTLANVDDGFGAISVAAENYASVIHFLGSNHLFTYIPKGETFSRFILNKMEEKQENVPVRYLVAATFQKHEITAWFNNFALHTAPMSLCHVHEALLQAYLLDPYARVIVSFHPLPFAHENRATLLDAPLNIDNILSINVVISLCLVWSICSVYIVKERITRFRLIQQMAGLRTVLYWLTMTLFDAINIVINSCAIMLAIWMLEEQDVQQTRVTHIHLLILVLIGFVVISFNYMLSIFFDDHIDVFIFSVTFSLYGSVAFASCYYVSDLGFSHVVTGILSSAWYFRIFPPFSLSNALVKIFKLQSANILCENEEVELMSRVYEECEVYPKCCVNAEYEDRHWYMGYEIDLLFSLLLALGFWTILFLVEFRLHRRLTKCCFERSYEDVTLTRHELLHRYSDPIGDDAMLNEKLKVLSLTTRQHSRQPLVCTAITKIVSSQPIVRDFYLTLDSGECLAIPIAFDYTVNMIFRILAGEVDTTSGTAYVHGKDLKYNRTEAYKNISYCPCVDPFLEEYTPAEILNMICLLRGIHSDQSRELSLSLSRIFGFRSHFDTPLYICSRGIMRRLTCACTIINTPSLMLLDRPNSSLDPAGQRQMWFVIDQLRRQRGVTVLFATLDPVYCEKVCTKLAIISKGRLLQFGTAADFSRTTRNFMLYVKMKHPILEMPHQLTNLQEFLRTNFSRVTIKERYSNVATFVIPYTLNKVSKVFEELEVNIFTLQIETFHIYPESFSSTCIDIMKSRRSL